MEVKYEFILVKILILIALLKKKRYYLYVYNVYTWFK